MESKRITESHYLAQLRDRLTSSPTQFVDVITTLVSDYNKDDARTWILDVLKKYQDHPVWKILLEDFTKLHIIKTKIMQYELEGGLSLRHIPAELREIYPLSLKTAEHLKQLSIDEKNIAQVNDFVLLTSLLLARKDKNRIDDESDPNKTARMKGFTENKSRQDMFDATIYRALVEVINKHPVVRNLIPIQIIPGQNEQEYISAMQWIDENSELRFKHYYFIHFLPKQVNRLSEYGSIANPAARYKVQLEQKEKLHILRNQADNINNSVSYLSIFEIKRLANTMGGVEHIKSDTIMNQLRDLELEFEQNIKRINETEKNKLKSILDWMPTLNFWQSTIDNDERQIVVKTFKEKQDHLQKLLDMAMRYELKKFYASNIVGNNYRIQLNLQIQSVMQDLQKTRKQKAFAETFYIYEGINVEGQAGQKREAKYYFWGVPEYRGSRHKLKYQVLYGLNWLLYISGLFLLIPLKNIFKYTIEYGPKRLEVYFENKLEETESNSTYLLAMIGYGLTKVAWLAGRTITSPLTSFVDMMQWSLGKVMQIGSYLKLLYRPSNKPMPLDKASIVLKSSNTTIKGIGGLTSHTIDKQEPLLTLEAKLDHSSNHYPEIQLEPDINKRYCGSC